MKRSELIFSALEVPLDFVMLVLAGLAAYAVRFSGWFQNWSPAQTALPLSEYIPLVMGVAAFWIIIYALAGLYRLKVTRSVVEEFFLVVVASLAGLAAVAVLIFFSRSFFESRLVVVLATALAIIFVGGARLALKKIQQSLVGRFGIGVHRVLIVGRNHGGRARELINELSRTRRFGYAIAAVEPSVNREKIARLLSKKRVDDVFVTDLAYEPSALRALAALCHEKGVGFHFTAGVFDTFRTEVHTLAAIPLVEVKNTPLEGWGRIAKRGVDILGGFVGVVLLVPVYVILGFIIKLDSPGPVIVSLKRLGQNGRPFRLYKFRSMQDKAWLAKPELLASNQRRGPLFKIKADPRITRVGRFIRRFRLDEFPQVLNVFLGEMSLVGPRPHEPQEVARYEAYQRRLLSIKPGITGLAQISGSSDLPFEQEVKLDTYYIENWSLLLDLKILIRTFVVLWTDRSAV